QRGHAAELALLDEICGLQPIACREHAVTRRRRAAALDVPEHRHARLVAGALLDLAYERGADASLRQPHVAELVDVTAVAGALELEALRDDDDGEVLAALVPAPDVVARLLDRDRLLRDQDHVRPAGDPAHDGDP